MNIQDLGPVAILFVFIAVVAAVGANILADVQADQTAAGFAWNATQAGLEGVDELASWLPLIALVIAAAVVISVLLFLRAR